MANDGDAESLESKDSHDVHCRMQVKHHTYHVKGVDLVGVALAAADGVLHHDIWLHKLHSITSTNMSAVMIAHNSNTARRKTLHTA